MQIQKGNLKLLIAQSLIVLYVLAASSYIQAQELPKDGQKSRPKLGLVLEGGGALGLAHIGVITWMEDHRIPVSYVAGPAWRPGWRNIHNLPLTR